jgi:hypothetical protein
VKTEWEIGKREADYWSKRQSIGENQKWYGLKKVTAGKDN